MQLVWFTPTDLGLLLLDKEDDETGEHEPDPDDKDEGNKLAQAHFNVHLRPATRNDKLTQDDELFSNATVDHNFADKN